MYLNWTVVGVRNVKNCVICCRYSHSKGNLVLAFVIYVCSCHLKANWFACLLVCFLGHLFRYLVYFLASKHMHASTVLFLARFVAELNIVWWIIILKIFRLLLSFENPLDRAKYNQFYSKHVRKYSEINPKKQPRLNILYNNKLEEV